MFEAGPGDACIVYIRDTVAQASVMKQSVFYLVMAAETCVCSRFAKTER